MVDLLRRLSVFLRSAGLEFETYKKKLFAVCRNFPLEILYVRDDDIPYYVETGIADLGIVGQNLLIELDSEVTELLPLEFGYCSLGVAVLKESAITTLNDLKGCKIATSYPNSTKKFFDSKNICVETVMISGSVEIAPTLGVASAIVDIVATGSTLALNDLKLLTKLYDCEAVLIATKNIKSNQKKKLINSLITRFNGVLAAKNYKYIMMNAPKSILPKLKKFVPGLFIPTQ
jgi:ATP phosphoribosyltransferase